MWKMTLKQRRRHRELMDLLDGMRNDPYLWPPEGYSAGENLEEDEKYQVSQDKFRSLVEELHELEESTK